jgi:hypothetical protein
VIEQGDRVQLKPVLLGHPLPHRGDNARKLLIRRETSVDLDHDCHPLFVVEMEREGGSSAGANCRVTAFSRELDVLGVVLETANDQQVLESARNDELSVGDESQIAGAKEWATTVSQTGTKCVFRLSNATPVATCDARRRNPDLADLARGALAARFGICDHDLGSERRRSAGHE